MKLKASQPVNPDQDRLLIDLKGLTHELKRCIEEGRFETAEEIDGQLELVFDRLFELKCSFSPIILDSSKARAKLAIYLNKIELAEIHLSFVSETCLGRPSGEWTVQFADCLECASRIAMDKRQWEQFAFYLEKCAEVRTKVLGPHHPDTLRAVREWDTFLDIMTDPTLDCAEAESRAL
jgi:hypothetical protein